MEGNSFQISWESIGRKKSVTEPVSGRARAGCVDCVEEEAVWPQRKGRDTRG